MIDTHAHIDAEEFDNDRNDTIQRAREAGISRIFVPAISLDGMHKLTDVCRQYAGYCLPMIGLHPEEVRADWREVLAQMRLMLDRNRAEATGAERYIAVGEVGLDFYWSREYEQEQLEAFEEQVRWSVETGLPLMIHCRKAQNEMVGILRKYAGRLPGGVFHCFTGNAIEARQLLDFPGFALGIGGVLTFKKSNLPDVLPQIPPERIVVETDAPYMAPVPMRGKRNESCFVPHIIRRMAECYNMSPEEVERITDRTAETIFPLPQ